MKKKHYSAVKDGITGVYLRDQYPDDPASGLITAISNVNYVKLIEDDMFGKLLKWVKNSGIKNSVSHKAAQKQNYNKYRTYNREETYLLMTQVLFWGLLRIDSMLASSLLEQAHPVSYNKLVNGIRSILPKKGRMSLKNATITRLHATMESFQSWKPVESPSFPVRLYYITLGKNKVYNDIANFIRVVDPYYLLIEALYAVEKGLPTTKEQNQLLKSHGYGARYNVTIYG